ncbi:ABC transporter ATP-binding protein [Saccharopolyspora phatthalungensis]|uniref:Multiple sugar transport system ATP-binding protein n=1 Tax=Saccharopolyspora phatthalungensis TaxID=664693 RepID=A0A840PX46_9PSEU|nr:sn-glycerol-3-phosphate ABC transporter ATP-binding protein UgpC [Saccharopolyspora phatthalungensis]MBB5152484.1 multiple sugar transport system ATP-binding protein [Saccharopolyspora phatthalungensis]MBB5158639.1 multiple sugar transport system ATP-binding protein [Saccharopolyspora phatthalungensis]
MAEVAYAEASRIYSGTHAVRAVDRLNLSIDDGEFLVLVGPSGSGKSTALRMLAGLEAVDEGEIRIGHRAVSTLAPKDRDIAMVFQSYALYPHMSVGENMGFALKLRRMPAAQIKDKVAEAAAMLDLTKYLDRKPKALSGGQRQRVAMGRAIVREPSVFLMDEPLSNLDAKLRVETRANIAALQQRLGTTTLYVTHDQVEAMTMGDRVAVLADGVLQQCASPRELYDHPANSFVAGFIGSPAMNLLTLPLDATGVQIGGLSIPLPRTVLTHATTHQLAEVTFGIRPESLRPATDTENGFDLTIRLVEELGSDAYLHGLIGDTDHKIVVRVDGRTPPQINQKIRVTIRNTTEIHTFDPNTTQRITG